MADSPRERRLRNDFAAIQKLQSESTILDFVAIGALPESYTLIFRGLGVWKPENHADVLTRDEHQVVVRFNASYPRMMPELMWKTPIFHPNISSSGVVCLGGYGTYWVPSVTLDELCTMLWDMIRYKNFDPESPYNRQAALWAKQHAGARFPIDPRPIRNKIASATTMPKVENANRGAISPPKSSRSIASTLERLFPSRASSSVPAPHLPRAEGRTAVANAIGSDPIARDPMSRAAAMLNPVDAEIVLAEVIESAPVVGASPVASGTVANRPASGDILFIE